MLDCKFTRGLSEAQILAFYYFRRRGRPYIQEETLEDSRWAEQVKRELGQFKDRGPIGIEVPSWEKESRSSSYYFPINSHVKPGFPLARGVRV